MVELSRREFMMNTGACASALALSGCAAISGRHTDTRPNVLFVVLDDLNDWLGCLGGHPDACTPNMDRLAARGVNFTNAHCTSPMCNPSRAAVLTGIRESSSGVYGNNQWFRRALPDAVTLPQYFRAHGYRALGGGKVFHARWPDPQSWDEYFPSQTKNVPPEVVPPRMPMAAIAEKKNFDWGAVDLAVEEMPDGLVVGWAARELRRRCDRPFFMAVGIHKPHLPWYLPKKYFDMFPPADIRLPVLKADELEGVPPAGRRVALSNVSHANVVQTGNYRNAVSAYLAATAFADACVGRLLDALAAGPHANDTIVVLWSDNGYHLGEKFHWCKFTLWERSARCPFMILAPGITPAGAVCKRAVSFLDIYPTLIDLCGLPGKPALQGMSMAALLRDPAAAWPRPALTTNQRGNHALRSDDYRYIRYADGSEELYDLKVDVHEWRNLAGDPALEAVKRDFRRWLPANDAPDAPSEERPREEE